MTQSCYVYIVRCADGTLYALAVGAKRQDVITDVYDRGEGKGAVVKTKLDVRDEAGNLVCTNYSTTFFHEAGGFGGKPMPKSDVVIPDREPDIEVDDYISPVQNLLYRLTGDTNRVHADPEYAQKMGYETSQAGRS